MDFKCTIIHMHNILLMIVFLREMVLFNVWGILTTMN